jgi:hypothetical protein
MSSPRPPDPSTLVFALLCAPRVAQGEVLDALCGAVAKPLAVSEARAFTQTVYYDREMGAGLRRLFCSVEGLWAPDRLAEIKLAANDLEGRWSKEGRRSVNLDPGLVDLTHLVLATGKPAAHRVYLGQGVYAEVEYVFEKGSFRPLPWTYPDYREPWATEFFNGIRAAQKAMRP